MEAPEQITSHAEVEALQIIDRLRAAMAQADANGHHNRQCVIYQSGPVALNQPRCTCWKADLLAAMAE